MATQANEAEAPGAPLEGEQSSTPPASAAPAETNLPRGHISKEDWVEQGNNPDDWRSPEVFAERGRWIKENRQLKDQIAHGKKDTDNQIKNLNLLHDIQLKNTISDLEAKRNTAIEDADTDTAVALQGQIDEVKDVQREVKATANTEPAEDPSVAAWNAANPWIAGNTPKASYARDQYAQNMNSGMNEAQALAAVDVAIDREFGPPQGNPNRQAPATGEGSGGPGRSRGKQGPSVTMKDLTRDEKLAWDNFGSSFKTEADFLKSVENSRKEA